MIVHLVKEQKDSLVTAKCGFQTKVGLRHPFAEMFTGFDSRVTCVHCKPSLKQDRKKRIVRIRRST